MSATSVRVTVGDVEVEEVEPRKLFGKWTRILRAWRCRKEDRPALYVYDYGGIRPLHSDESVQDWATEAVQTLLMRGQ